MENCWFLNASLLGNRLSLRDMPNESGTNVYEVLREFQLKYYNAPLMTLAIESRGNDFNQTNYTASLRYIGLSRGNGYWNLRSSSQSVCSSFHLFMLRNSVAPDFSPFVNPFPPSAYKKIYKSEGVIFVFWWFPVCPVKETVMMTFLWSLPPMQSQYRCC